MSNAASTATKPATDNAAARAFDAAPFFALWRASFDEAQAHADRWMALATSQMAENARVAATLRAQGMSAFRGAIDVAERMTGDVVAAATSLTAIPSVRK